MRILVCGGRDFGTPTKDPTHNWLEEYNFIQQELNRIVNQASIHFQFSSNWLPTDIVIIHGNAKGVDRAAGDFATVNFCEEIAFTADWAKYGPRAGYIRNKQMLDEGQPDLVVAFPGGNGTAMMIKLATKAGVKVIKLPYNPPKDEAFQTSHWQKIYFDRIQEKTKGMATPGQKRGIFLECLREEKEWLNNMGSEYDEIIAAQDAMTKQTPQS